MNRTFEPSDEDEIATEITHHTTRMCTLSDTGLIEARRGPLRARRAVRLRHHD